MVQPVEQPPSPTGVKDTARSPSPAFEATSTVLRMRSIRKSFGGVHALKGVDFDLRPGEIRGLIGENGSGKSTLLNILAGQFRPDAGSIEIAGESRDFASPADALRSGIAMVSQELSLAPELSVGENIFLGHGKPRRTGLIDWRELHRRAALTLERLQVEIDTRAQTGRLRLDQQQLVEIARAVNTDARILILDEPTSSLTEEAVAALFAIMRLVASEGVAVVYVSHKMDELFEVSDRITVLRDGVHIDTRARRDYDRTSLVADMLGRLPEVFVPSTIPIDSKDRALVVHELNVPGQVVDADFSLSRGEVLGLVGLSGSGRSQLLEALFGLQDKAHGTVSIGASDRIPRSPLEAMRRGMAFVPSDRKTQGLSIKATIRENVVVPMFSHRPRWKIAPARSERRIAADNIKAMNIVTPSDSVKVTALSGGNQQKVLLSKWLNTTPEVLLLDEPTRGVDVGSKAEIHEILRAQRDRGMSIVVVSSEIEELLQLCDRFLVMFQGRVIAQLSRTEASEARLNHLASGVIE
ncbi:ATP-binding cassette domain-containing protein [Nocardia sp. R6R-6]|uniref:ATP-binding cassette domain-containing protein n=1 Tax=Nocardia sp. R6R-6 TaxID=3459303 RepID=UPI00403E215A